MSPRALACPASLKSVLTAPTAAGALAVGFERVGVHCVRMPVADGGEGTVDVLCSHFEEVETVDAFGRPRVARAGVLGEARVIEAAEAIPLDPSRLDVMAASSRGLGLWISQYRDRPLIITVGGTATMDAGAGMLEVLDRLPGPTRVLCDVTTTLHDAPRLFGPQKGATPEQIAELEERFSGQLDPWADLSGSGAAGGLGAALASLGAELVPGAELVLERTGFRERLDGAALAVTGEGHVDRTTLEGKAPGAVARVCREQGVRCVVLGGRVLEEIPGAEAVALSGDPARAVDDLREAGEALALALLGRA